MTAGSKFILGWDIDSEAFATGRVETGVIEWAGFKWSAEMQKMYGGARRFTLNCDCDHAGPWKCEVNVDEVAFRVNRASVTIHPVVEGHLLFNVASTRSKIATVMPHKWKHLKSATKNRDNSISMEFGMSLISSTRVEPNKFAAPNRMSNVVLKIGYKKLHVSKEYLAVHSPVFQAMFFGSFVEKGKEEVELKDVDYEEFVDLLELIYLGSTKITDRTVHHILKLADQFQMESVTDQAVAYLTQSGEFDAMAKLLIADQYRLAALKDHCLNSFTSARELSQQFKSSLQKPLPFSKEMKSAVYERIGQLTVEG